MKTKRGFIITLDAIAAFAFMLIALYYLQTVEFNQPALEGAQLKAFSLDTLSILVKSGRLGNAVDGETNMVRDVLIASPEHNCMQISIFYANGSVMTTIEKPGCSGTGREEQVANGFFAHRQSTYLVSVKSWYLQEES